MPVINDDTAQFKLPKKLKAESQKLADKLGKSWSARMRRLMEQDLEVHKRKKKRRSKR